MYFRLLINLFSILKKHLKVIYFRILSVASSQFVVTCIKKLNCNKKL